METKTGCLPHAHPTRSPAGCPSPSLRRRVRGLALQYVTVMVVRYFISGHLHPERRFWPPGSLPIFFHFVLAAYLYVLSRLARWPIAAPV
jgi:hypothetical protein